MLTVQLALRLAGVALLCAQSVLWTVAPSFTEPADRRACRVIAAVNLFAGVVCLIASFIVWRY